MRLESVQLIKYDVVILLSYREMLEHVVAGYLDCGGPRMFLPRPFLTRH